MRGAAAPRARALPPWYVGLMVYYDLFEVYYDLLLRFDYDLLWFAMGWYDWINMVHYDR